MQEAEPAAGARDGVNMRVCVTVGVWHVVH